MTNGEKIDADYHYTFLTFRDNHYLNSGSGRDTESIRDIIANNADYALLLVNGYPFMHVSRADETKPDKRWQLTPMTPGFDIRSEHIRRLEAVHNE